MELIIRATMYTIIGMSVLAIVPFFLLGVAWLGATLVHLIKKLLNLFN